MIRMTRQADYGIVLLTYFADHRPGEATFTARDLAAETHLPVPMVSKILKTLAREGLLASQRGVHGGYRLERSPDQISVVDIITALEGPIGITECTLDDPGTCDIAARCAVRSNWQTINRVVRDALSRITLSQMAGPMRASAVGRAATGVPS
jgi:FeS assembly SUF system regulator